MFVQMHPLAYLRCWVRVSVASAEGLFDEFLGKFLDGYKLFERGQCSQSLTFLLAENRPAGAIVDTMDI
jgi:hypothetical protein